MTVTGATHLPAPSVQDPDQQHLIFRWTAMDPHGPEKEAEVPKSSELPEAAQQVGNGENSAGSAGLFPQGPGATLTWPGLACRASCRRLRCHAGARWGSTDPGEMAEGPIAAVNTHPHLLSWPPAPPSQINKPRTRKRKKKFLTFHNLFLEFRLFL